MPTVPHINKCVFRHLAPEISHFPKNLITTSVLSLVNSLRFENQSREVPHTARLFKIASQRQSCRLNMLNRQVCRRRDVRQGNPSRRHTITPPRLRPIVYAATVEMRRIVDNRAVCGGLNSSLTFLYNAVDEVNFEETPTIK